jgi:hypothetical protein
MPAIGRGLHGLYQQNARNNGKVKIHEVIELEGLRGEDL